MKITFITLSKKMEIVKINILEELKKFCEKKNVRFLAGSNFYQNYKANRTIYEDGELVLAADFNLSLIRGRGNSIETFRFSGYIALGRKFDESGTFSSIAETFEQKYERRLKELTELLSTYIAELACDCDMIIISEDYSNELNKFDTQIDFVVCKLIFEI